jgi:hypothetical protein
MRWVTNIYFAAKLGVLKILHMVVEADVKFQISNALIFVLCVN